MGEVEQGAFRNVSQILALPGWSASTSPGVVLALEPAGLLHAWSLDGRSAPLRWQLPVAGVAPYRGICAARGELYFLGAPSDGRPAAIWKATWPHSLRSIYEGRQLFKNSDPTI